MQNTGKVKEKGAKMRRKRFRLPDFALGGVVETTNFHGRSFSLIFRSRVGSLVSKKIPSCPKTPRFSPGTLYANAYQKPPVLPRFSSQMPPVLPRFFRAPPVLPRFSPGSPPVLPRFSPHSTPTVKISSSFPMEPFLESLWGPLVPISAYLCPLGVAILCY